MQNKITDKVIEYFRKLHEEGAPVNSAGAGGFTGSANPKGPVAGFDPVMGFRKRGSQIKLPPGSRKRWMKGKK